LTKLTIDELSYLQLLLSIEGIGVARSLLLKNHFTDFQNVFSAHINSIQDIESISTVLANRIKNASSQIEEFKKLTESQFKIAERLNADIVTYFDDEYPEYLRNIYLPPLILFVKGKFSASDDNSIAIVGTRNPTQYGKTQAERFTTELVNNGIVVISGLARGIDSIAHSSTLKSGGRTIAVVGSGLDVIYPPENKRIFDEIPENGMIISEFDFGTKPDAQNFPRRNRIISGLSLGTLVVESDINGGAMQTANYAFDQNREVFAVPGNLNVKQSEGTNWLIQTGKAKLVKNPEDILIELKLKLVPEIGKNIPQPKPDLNLFEEKIYNTLTGEAKHIDEIAGLSGLSIPDCLVNLLSLEFKNVVRQLPGKKFERI
jgi:DNA processing protein